MNALTPLPPSAQPEKIIFPEVSSDLMKQLAASGSSLDAVDGICRSPALHAEACALVPKLAALTGPAGQEGVMAVLGKLFAIYPQPDRSEAEWAAWWEAYIEDLSMIPEWALADGAKDYRREPTSEFFPKPGILREFAGKRAAYVVQALARARMASRQEPRRQIEAVSPEQRHELAESLRTALKVVPQTDGEKSRAEQNSSAITNPKN